METKIATFSNEYALSHGIVKYVANSSNVVAAPHTLYSTKLPMKMEDFELLKELAPLLNTAIHRMALDDEFLVENLKLVAQGDKEFTGKLYEIYKRLKGTKQKIMMGLHRSDYMLHQGENGHLFQQVEINTISSAFGALTTKVTAMHEYLDKRLKLNRPTVPSESLESIAKMFFEAHQCIDGAGVILFIVQEGETNFADQRLLEFKIFEDYQVPVKRVTLEDVHKNAILSESDELLYEGDIVSVVYFRAGYTPKDYPGEIQWKARELMEHSTAIKCPTIQYHLLGTKYMQFIFGQPNVLERYLSEENAKKVRSVFTGIFDLENEEEVQKAIKNPADYVVKPQREGGGNLLFHDKMVELLKSDDKELKSGYILMKRIQPPHVKVSAFRDGKITTFDGVSELGVYGLYLGDENKTIVNEYGGYLLRTKGKDVEDGGVSSGVAFLDSIST